MVINCYLPLEYLWNIILTFVWNAVCRGHFVWIRFIEVLLWITWAHFFFNLCYIIHLFVWWIHGWYVQRSESEDGVVIAFHHVGPRCWAHVRLDSRIPYLLSRHTDCLERPSRATKQNLRKQKYLLPTWTTWDKERADFPKFSSDLSHEYHGIHVPPCMHTAPNKCDFKE